MLTFCSENNLERHSIMNVKFDTLVKALKESFHRTCSLFHVPGSLPKFPVPCSLRPAFTLVELLVVIAIIGILMAVLLPNFFGGRESARAARCLANLKNFGNAVQTYGMSTGYFPRAGSCEVMEIDLSTTTDKSSRKYSEVPGWVSWYSEGMYPGKKSGGGTLVGLYSTTRDQYEYALSNGALWPYVARNSQSYICPSHVKARNAKGKSMPHWSYLMSAYFGGNSSTTVVGSGRILYRSLEKSDRRLLFCEVPFMGYSSDEPDGAGASTMTDAVLQSTERIGANHVSGQNLFAHVCYADGHAEKLRIPYSGSIKNPKADDTQLQNLTKWLYNGTDVSFDGKTYKELN